MSDRNKKELQERFNEILNEVGKSERLKNER